MNYAGIGSCETPLDVQFYMDKIAIYLAQCGHTLRTGGAKGADTAFMVGAHSVTSRLLEIYTTRQVDANPAWETLAKCYHPAWDRLNPYAQLLQARNTPIILGADLLHPVDFVVCWTPGGKVTGGTGQALRIAAAYKIPVFNLWFKDAAPSLWAHLGVAV